MITSFTSSSSSSSASSHSSAGHCHREENGVGIFEHLHLPHTPPPLPSRFRGKHHRHRHHSCPSPPPPLHRHHHFAEHPYHSPLLHSAADHHHHENGKLRVKPPKPSKKVCKLHHKLMKAYKLPKSARHHGRHHHHMHFPPPKKGFFSTHIDDHHPSGCCLHSMEEGFPCEERSGCRLEEMGFRRRVHSHPSDTLKSCPMRPLIKSEVVGGAVAVVSPSAAEAPAEPPIEGGTLAPASAMLLSDEPALAQ